MGHTIALDVATARPPPAPPPRACWAGRGRDLGAAGTGGALAGARGRGVSGLSDAWMRLRRRSSTATATRPMITSKSSPMTATSSVRSPAPNSPDAATEVARSTRSKRPEVAQSDPCKRSNQRPRGQCGNRRAPTARRFQILRFAVLRIAMPDLVIGGRRAGVARPWRAGVIVVAMIGVAGIVAWFIYRRAVAYEVPPGQVQGEIAWQPPAPGQPPALVYGNASLAWLGGVAVLHVAGDAHAIGASHGRLLAPWLRPIAAAIAPAIAATVPDDGMLGSATHGMRLAWRWRFVDDGLIDADRRMVAGLARGAAASGAALGYDELLRDQAALDVGAPSPRSDQAGQHTIARSLTLIGAQAQSPARVWIGRAVALPGLDDGGDSALPVVTIARPDGRIAWASVGWPGLLGVITGINAEGIAVMVDPARTVDVRVTRTARPIALLARTVLEQARTLDDAIKLIEGSATLGSAVFAVVDGTTGKWVQVERTPSKAIVERSPRSPALGDVLTTNALSGDPENDRTKRMPTTQSRTERAQKLLRAPLPDVAAMAAVLRDRAARAVGRRSARRRPDARARSPARAAQRGRPPGAGRRHRGRARRARARRARRRARRPARGPQRARRR
ncbi:MAG: hypothetical protein E6J91_01145 [Deltaproteobacteria bacterium]|nr:MAG: hypothetical protein E6J91_01145 [Deltaproteobacteria bacterium]